MNWSASFLVTPTTDTSGRSMATLPGDKILLPPSALQQLLAVAPLVATQPGPTTRLTADHDPFNPFTHAAERIARENLTVSNQQPQLPHPLTFRLVNPINGRAVYAGIREFSAAEGEIVLSGWLRATLAVALPNHSATSDTLAANTLPGHDPDITIDVPTRISIQVRELPKGTYVKLRPLEAGYDAENWKALLEFHLRDNFTTLTKGEILSIPRERGGATTDDNFKFLVDGFKPEGQAICVVDTDLEVDLEAFSEEQARETARILADRAQGTPGTESQGSPGGKIDLFRSQTGHVQSGAWVDYYLPSWDRSQGIEIELSAQDDHDVDLFVSPLAPRHRAPPRQDEYVFAAIDGRYPKRICIPPTSDELNDADAVQISVRSLAHSVSHGSTPTPYTISVNPYNLTSPTLSARSLGVETGPDPDDHQCDTCRQWIPGGSMVLHKNFCSRNNVLCPHGCGQIFQRRSPEWAAHWHCEHDDAYGANAASHAKHDSHFHASVACRSCKRSFASCAALAAHRTTVCPGKLILCQFCHLQVPQEGDPDTPDAAAILSGLTAHELEDGARTADCQKCNRPVRLRDMRTHMTNHLMENYGRPTPILCRNVNCGRTVHGTALNGNTRLYSYLALNDVGLCRQCFSPLYVPLHDPDGRALRRRVERRCIAQLLMGCRQPTCQSMFCRSGRANTGLPERGLVTKEAMPMIAPEMDGWASGAPIYFCVDKTSQDDKAMAERIAADGQYAAAWCGGALEACSGNMDAAREWLFLMAPKLSPCQQ